MSNLAEIIARLRHLATTELPVAQATELHAELARRHRQLVTLVGDDLPGHFTLARQDLEACAKLTTMITQRLAHCRQEIQDATAHLR